VAGADTRSLNSLAGDTSPLTAERVAEVSDANALAAIGREDAADETFNPKGCAGRLVKIAYDAVDTLESSIMPRTGSLLAKADGKPPGIGPRSGRLGPDCTGFVFWSAGRTAKAPTTPSLRALEGNGMTCC
jgi:hypothetical protein